MCINSAGYRVKSFFKYWKWHIKKISEILEMNWNVMKSLAISKNKYNNHLFARQLKLILVTWYYWYITKLRKKDAAPTKITLLTFPRGNLVTITVRKERETEGNEGISLLGNAISVHDASAFCSACPFLICTIGNGTSTNILLSICQK